MAIAGKRLGLEPGEDSAVGMCSDDGKKDDTLLISYHGDESLL